MITIPEAARRVGRDPETLRRWVRSGKLSSHKIGMQHLVDEDELGEVAGGRSLPVPKGWEHFDSGRPQPDWAGALERSRSRR